MAASEPISSIDKALDSPDAEERRQATARLSELSLAFALPLLVRSLGDEDWRVRKEATIVARAFGAAPELVSELVELLGVSDNIGLRNAVVEVLAGIGPAGTAPIAKAMASLDADGRKLAVEVLGRSRDPLAIEPLEAALLRDPDDNVRQGAIEAIARLGPVVRDRAEQILLHSLGDRDRLVRLTALEGLRALEVAIPWPELEPLLGDAALRPLALSAAAHAESPEAVWALARALSRSRGGSFAVELAALARLARGPLADTVAAALRAEGPELGERLVALAAGAGGEAIEQRAMALRLAAAARANGVMDAALSALSEDMLADPAQRALKSIGLGALPAMIERLSDPAVQSGIRAELIEVTVEIALSAQDVEGGPLSVPMRFALLSAIRGAALEADRTVAASALSALARFGDESDLEMIALQTLGGERAIALAAEGALATLAGRFPAEARRVARAMAAREAFALPVAILLGVLATLGASGDDDAALLAQIAAAGDVRARRAAVLAVADMGGRTAKDVLSFALADEEHEVQLAAARALGRRSAATGGGGAGETLDLVERSGAVDLVAATVRAIGEGVRLVYGDRRARPPQPLSPELFEKLAAFAGGAPSPLAIAAVDALGHALAADALAASRALMAALDHADVAVVKAAMFKLAASPIGHEALSRGLGHSSPGVRTLAVEMLADLPDAYEQLSAHAAIEADPGVQLALDRALARSSRPSVRPGALTSGPSSEARAPADGAAAPPSGREGR